MTRPASGQGDHFGRSPDSRVNAWPGLPTVLWHSSDIIPASLSAYSCGGSHGIGALWLHRTVFPIIQTAHHPDRSESAITAGSQSWEEKFFPIGGFVVFPLCSDETNKVGQEITFTGFRHPTGW